MAASTIEGLLPWHEPQWCSVIARHRLGRLPHALLLCGASGMGKLHFARLLAQALLCTRPEPDGTPCQHCGACNLYRAGTHPAVREVTPEETGKVIRIDQVRALSSFMALTSSGHKIGIIAPAHEMNLAAANSLLKTLEEPPPRSLLVLVAAQPGRLPPTVRSRCQRVWFGPCEGPAAETWLARHVPQSQARVLLEVAAGAPLAAAELSRGDGLKDRRRLFSRFEEVVTGRTDPCIASQDWTDIGLEAGLRWMGAWLRDMIRLKWVAAPPRLESPDLTEGLRVLAQGLSLEALHIGVERCSEALDLVLSRANLNGPLLVEDLLTDWQGGARVAHRES
jgi:DNA polymerase III subunit delta'